jgi:hypothetical protein
MHNLLSISVLAVFPGYSGFHLIIGENDTPFVRAGEYAGIQHCRHITVNGLDITAGTAGCFSN